MIAGEKRWGYGFGPFRLESEIDLADLRLVRRPGGLAVGVSRGPVQLDALPATRLNSSVVAGPKVCALDVPGLARFAVTGGTRVVIDAAPDANIADVRGYLTAWVFGVLCHQNGMLPLHASAVENAGVATAFLGESGAGKSTLAAFLARRGFAILCDDICLLRPTPRGMAVEPVAEWLKLWRGTLEALGQTADGRDRTYSDEDKYRVYGMGGADSAPGPVRTLRNLVFLERGKAPARLERLSTAAVMGRMMRTVYLGYCMEAMGVEERAFRQCAEIVGGAQGWVLTAPWGFERMPGTLELLEQHILRGPRA